MIEVPILEIRTFDVVVLMIVGALLEVVTKGILIGVKSKSQTERKADAKLHQLNFEAAKTRSLGPSAFVETSKLERQILTKEREIAKIAESRKDRSNRINGFIGRFGYLIYIVVFVSYYGLNVLSIDGTRVGDAAMIAMSSEEEKERATAFLQGFLFPLSYIGIGMRLARFGLPTPGFGALLVLWSAQTTVGKLIDGIEVLILNT
mmetsp:Transcript_39053/g.44536  ORF Transcript_39053/g.44536 Transcript_39053/m.44536 type:complete len:205 (-) Transcript_39053:90-704(-)|eukprot:CAMPEP_0194131848 /NCGR_PEP_ID=MMETSP0152-20130528/2498_1 /TAXON_ID=1049557 /ORGANISM="Thalassiothrix antarctica, Strain L6-D1" /LENGTH=204 /DNA_ID=CAMNT_0038826731 /DNA_START=108 /DNA_END=722 /DNA_ORIENTATION=+